jgi:hypothetical protein
MTATEDILSIFSIFHDGTITEWTGNKDRLTLTIDCAYLAERIDKSFEYFYVELHHIDTVAFDPWTQPAHLPAVIKTALAEVFEATLEILSAGIKDDTVMITCYQYDTDLDYSGGNLFISCQVIKVFDQHRNALTIDRLGEICNNYWDELGKR